MLFFIVDSITIRLSLYLVSPLSVNYYYYYRYYDPFCLLLDILTFLVTIYGTNAFKKTDILL